MEVLPFDDSNLAEAFSNKYTNVEAIRGKDHFDYFLDYLGSDGLDARTIVIEEEYISKDFLHDFASYYSLCFEDYPKRCKRIHFFDQDFSKEQLEEELLRPDQEEEFWTHYLGFIVIKPIPKTIIGFTLLKTYDTGLAIEQRKYWGTRFYDIHFFGKKISIESLAFQEQDSVLAACATTAIWSMLNKAAADFHTVLKSPSEITKDADTISPDGSRLFPNKGLDLLQVCQAIYKSGLVSEVKPPDCSIDISGEQVNIISNLYLKKLLRAYSPIGIPIILVVIVPSGEEYGLHAITVSGFKCALLPTLLEDNSSTPSWAAEFITRIYAHDDQFGPFVRILFDDSVDAVSLKTPWSLNDERQRPTYVSNVIVPLYPKIRISYEDVDVYAIGLDAILNLFFDKKLRLDLIWDIQLMFSEKFKSEILSSEIINDKKLRVLSSSMPKYIWVVSCWIGTFKLFDFTLDATGVSVGMIGLDAVCYHEDILPFVIENLQHNRHVILSMLNHSANAGYLDLLIEKLNEQMPSE